jgi:hypothetical protein
MDPDLKKYLLKKAREDKRVFEGFSASSDRGHAGVTQNINPRPGGKGRWVKPTIDLQHDFNVAPLQKRTDLQRVESLTKRLLEAVKNHQPGEMEYILQQMSVEGWKAGTPISYEECKRVAIEALKKAADKMQEEERTKF